MAIRKDKFWLQFSVFRQSLLPPWLELKILLTMTHFKMIFFPNSSITLRLYQLMRGSPRLMSMYVQFSAAYEFYYQLQQCQQNLVILSRMTSSFIAAALRIYLLPSGRLLIFISTALPTPPIRQLKSNEIVIKDLLP